MVVTNPSHPRRHRRRRNPGRTHRMRRRIARRRNPSSSWGAAAAATGLGALGGLGGLALDYGASKIPVGPYAQAGIEFGTGVVLSVLIAKFASHTVGAGLAGGTAAMVGGRVVQAIQMAKLSEPAGASASQPQSAAGMFPEAGRVYRETGRVYNEAGAPVRHGPEAGRVLPGAPPRLFGPSRTLASAGPFRVVSAHNAR